MCHERTLTRRFPAGVDWGHAALGGTSSSTASSLNPRRRPLGFSRTEPVLSFAGTGAVAPAPVASWQSGKDILDEVYAQAGAFGKRSNELRPMWETGSATESHASAHSSRRQDSGFIPAAAAGGAAAPADDEGDGFDLDEAFGTAGTTRFGLFAAGGANKDSQDSSKTTTQRLKRAFTDAEEAEPADDEEMAATDVEDEEDDEAPGPMSMFATASAAAGPRRFAGLKRGFAKTQSLPPSAFAGKMEF